MDASEVIALVIVVVLVYVWILSRRLPPETMGPKISGEILGFPHQTVYYPSWARAMNEADVPPTEAAVVNACQKDHMCAAVEYTAGIRGLTPPTFWAATIGPRANAVNYRPTSEKLGPNLYIKAAYAAVARRMPGTTIHDP